MPFCFPLQYSECLQANAGLLQGYSPCRVSDCHRCLCIHVPDWCRWLHHHHLWLLGFWGERWIEVVISSTRSLIINDFTWIKTERFHRDKNPTWHTHTCLSPSETQCSSWYSLHPFRGPSSRGLPSDAAPSVQHHDHRQSLVPAQGCLWKTHLPGWVHVFRLLAFVYLFWRGLMFRWQELSPAFSFAPGDSCVWDPPVDVLHLACCHWKVKSK